MAEKCESCSKENANKVNVRRFIEKLDTFFARNDLNGAGEFLDYWENEASVLNDNSGLLSVLNEKIGFYRRTNESTKGLSAVENALALLNGGEFEESVAVGTIYVNCATTLKHFGYPEKAISLYEKAEAIYNGFSTASDFEKASLYNNFASAYGDLGSFEKAETNYFKAIEILEKSGSNNGEIAVSYVNLAHIYFEIDNFSEKVNECLEKAWDYLNNERNKKDGNYAFICSKCALSYGFFGQFLREEYLKQEAERIYEGS